MNVENRVHDPNDSAERHHVRIRHGADGFKPEEIQDSFLVDGRPVFTSTDGDGFFDLFPPDAAPLRKRPIRGRDDETTRVFPLLPPASVEFVRRFGHAVSSVSYIGNHAPPLEINLKILSLDGCSSR